MVSTVVEGEELGEALLASLRSEAAGVLGENVAQEIGAAVANGDLDTAAQLIAHAALGCATGLIGSGDCVSGASGAVIGEATALLYKEHITGWFADRMTDVQAGTLDAEQLIQDLEQMRKDGVDIARLFSGLTVGLAGGDVNVAAEAGANAAEHNGLSKLYGELVSFFSQGDRACRTQACLTVLGIVYAGAVIEGMTFQDEDPELCWDTQDDTRIRSI